MTKYTDYLLGLICLWLLALSILALVILKFQSDQLAEQRITNMFLRGQVPEAKNPDRCGH